MSIQINLKGTNLELTEDIKDYVLKRVTNLEKFLKNVEEGGGDVNVNFEVSKSTNHHSKGDVFHADCLINIDGEKFYSSADEEDIKSAIDVIKENIYRDISKKKEKKQTLFYRGARKVKNMMKGVASYRPWKK